VRYFNFAKHYEKGRLEVHTNMKAMYDVSSRRIKAFQDILKITKATPEMQKVIEERLHWREQAATEKIEE